MADILFIDLETTGLSPFKNKLHGVGAAMNADHPTYFAAGHVPDWIRFALASETVAKVGSNIRGFDLNFLAQQGWTVAGPSYDTSLMSLVADDSYKEHGLKQLSARLFGAESLKSKTDLDMLLAKLDLRHVGQLAALDLADPTRPHFSLIARYCVEDVINTRNVYFAMRDQLRAADKADKAAGRAIGRRDYFVNEVVPTEQLLLKMEVAGVRVNAPLLADIEVAAKAELEIDTNKFYETCKDGIDVVEKHLIEREQAKKKTAVGKERVAANPAKYGADFNLGSAQHVGKLFYEVLGCPPDLIQYTKKKAYSTKEENLNLILASLEPDSALAAALELYSEIKKSSKLVNTYVGNEEKGLKSLLQTKGNGETWLFPNYKQRTATGRLSVFPLQQLPNAHKNPKAAVVKKFFIPSTPDHCFLYADYSAVELGNAAHLSQDPTMLHMIREGLDMHIALGAKAFRKDPATIGKKDLPRVVGKTLNYLLIYGGKCGRLRQELALKNRLDFSREQCDEFIESHAALYPRYNQYLSEIKEFVEKNGYVVAENGRIRHLPDIFFGKYLNHAKKTFFGPLPLYLQLQDEPGQRLRPADAYYRARQKHNHALNQAYNFPNQSLGGTLMKNAMAAVDKARFTIRASIHDALVLEVRKSEAATRAVEFKSLMEAAYPQLSVPLVAEVKILNSFSEDDIFVPADIAIAT